MSGNNANHTVNLVSTKAVRFIQKYYELLDKPDKRPQWVKLFMPIQTEHPLMIWNGHILPTQQDIENYAKQLPETKHATSSIDAQPIMNNNNDFIVTVQGTVTYGDNHKRRFFHRITYTHAPGSNDPFISSDYMRWTGDA